MSWSAKQYVAFEEQRTRPVRDLVTALPARAVRSAIDIGCGPGNSTEVLAARFPQAAIVGLDSSPDMVAAARRRLPTLAFDIGDIESWAYGTAADSGAGETVDAGVRAGFGGSTARMASRQVGPFDVILANAVLQWVPDHSRLLPALMSKLARGGALAVQMPDNLDEPAHVLMREVAAAGPWRGRLESAAAARTSVPTASEYYEMVHAWASVTDIWRTTYHHPLAGGAADIVEWFKGSGLRPFLAPLQGDEAAEFLARYQAAVAQAYPAMPDGSVLLPFPRLFIVAVR